MLLEPATLKKLDALALGARRAFTGASKGEKRSTRRGSSVEFADFRAYNAGDDIRRLDWAAYGRFEKLFLKMFLEEEDLDVTLLLDTSLSMGYGEPSKLLAAQRLAAAVGYIGLKGFDRVGAAGFDRTLHSRFPPARGQGAAQRLFHWLEACSAGGEAELNGPMQRVAATAQRGGLAWVFSDFLLPGGYETGLKILAARGFEVTAVQILSREELEPSLVGDLKLVDAESGAMREVSISARLLQTYKRNLDAHTGGLKTFCRTFGMNYLLVPSDAPPEEVILKMMRGEGVVK